MSLSNEEAFFEGVKWRRGGGLNRSETPFRFGVDFSNFGDQEACADMQKIKHFISIPNGIFEIPLPLIELCIVLSVGRFLFSTSCSISQVVQMKVPCLCLQRRLASLCFAIVD